MEAASLPTAAPLAVAPPPTPSSTPPSACSSRSGTRGISTRRLAAEAGANQGLVHYYFGSMDELFVQVLERFTERLVARQREMYAADVPFIEKWRTAWRFQEEDLEAGYSKIWMELQALSWSHPDLRPRVARVNAEWRGVLREAFERAAQEYGLDEDEFPVEALVAMTMTFAPGLRARAAGGDRRGPRRAARLDRALARVARGEEEDGMTIAEAAPAHAAGRAEPRPLPGRGGLHRARRRARLLGVLRPGRADDPLPADLDARALARLEGADPVLRPPLPRDLLRPARQRPLRPPAGARAPTTRPSSPRTRST